MSRFARVTEEVYLRRRELADPNRKQGYQETFFLYQIILLHSWATGKCDKPLPELCELYNLEYHNSTRRLKILREKSWVEDTDKYIRPLLIHRAGKKSVIFTPNPSVKITPPSVKITPPECKNYTENAENSVNFTPENRETTLPTTTYDDAMTSFKFKTNLNAAAAEKNAAAAAETNEHLSKFSIEECLQYAQICVNRGEPIKNPHGLATRSYQTGEHDVFIQATLYPEPTIEKEYKAQSEPLEDALAILLDVRASGDAIADFERFYTPADWASLMEKLDAHAE